MISSIRNKPIYRFFIWLTVGVCLISIYYLMSILGSEFLRAGDTVNYWAAGKLMLRGDNPYSMDQVLEFQQEIGIEQAFSGSPITMVLYPPWMLPLTLPLGFFDFPITRFVWLLFNLILILISIKYIWFLYGGSSKRIMILYLVTITFAPTIFLLGFGQITSILLLGVVFFLYFIQKESDKRLNYFYAGAAASLVAFKPQILYLLIFALLIWIVRNRSWLVLLGGISALLVLTLISMAFDPLVINHYWGAISNYPLGTWATPTIGYILRANFGFENEWLQLLPIIIGIIWFSVRWRQQYQEWDWLEEMPLLLLVCVVTFPYGWIYDMIVLLIPVLAVFAVISQRPNNWKSLAIIVSFFILNILNLFLHKIFYENWFVWFAPALLVWYLFGRRVLNVVQPSRLINGTTSTQLENQ